MRDTNALINKKVKKTTQVTGSKGTRQATKFAPQSPRQAKRIKNIQASEKRRAAKNKLNRVSKAIMTLGGSEVTRKLVKSGTGQKIIKRVKQEFSPRNFVNTYKRMAKESYDAGRNVGKKINKAIGNEGGLLNRKRSSFKMKGFSGFGNSPAKQKEDKYPMLKPGDKESRSDTVLAGSRHFPGYDNLSKENKKKVKDATNRLGGYTPSLKEVYRQFKGQ